MNSKGFISIYFSLDEILLVALDASKKRIKKYASATLPKGLIADYRVTNPKLLSQILKEVWKKLKIKEKSVSVVIPEYSTFLKVLKISKVGISEINEALGWQLGEILPYQMEEAVTDWKILKKEDKEYTVLSLSIRKDVLKTYLESFELAGLFPVIVETPSLCLSRAFKAEGGQLVIYASGGVTTFVLQSGDSPLGSAIISDSGPEVIVKTALGMIDHYKKEIEVQKIICVGVDLSSHLEKSKFKVENWKNNFAGVSEDEACKFLIAISSQIQDINVPSDPFTINLVPNEIIRRYQAEKTRLQVWSMGLSVTLFVWLSLLSAVATYVFVGAGIVDLKNKVDSLSRSDVGRNESMSKVKMINDLSNKVMKIKSESYDVSSILNSIFQAVPQGVNVESYKLDIEQGVISLVGIAPTRQDLVNFRDNLEKLEQFESPEIPVSSYEKELNLDFEVVIKYSPASKRGKEVKDVRKAR
jgi:hypothetical protein